MAAPTHVATSAPAATSTTAVAAYPAGLAANDLLMLVVSSDSAGIGQPGTSPAGGWTQQGAVQTGGGTSVAVWVANSDGTEAGSVTTPITGGTKGATWMSAYRAAAGGDILQATVSRGSDTDTSSTAIGVTGGTSFTTATDDLIVFAGLLAANPGGSTFSGGISAGTITQATMGTYTARSSARTGTNTLFYIQADRPVTTGGSAAPAFTATAAGANASGSGIFLRLHESVANTPPTANAGADQVVAPWSTVTVSAAGSADPDGTIAGYAWTRVSGPAVTLSGASTSTCTFTAPASMSGATVVLGLVVTDNLGASSAQDTVSITVNRATEAMLVGGVWTPIRIWVRSS